MTLESIIRDHLDAEAAVVDIAPPSIDTLRGSARRRNRRRRGLVAAAGLVAVAGIGLGIAPDRVTEPGAVVISQPESEGRGVDGRAEGDRDSGETSAADAQSESEGRGVDGDGGLSASDPTDPNRVTDAAASEGAGSSIAGTDDDPEGPALGPLPETMTVTPVDPPASAPRPAMFEFVAPDGSGGFVGFDNGNPLDPIEIRRSDDGETWTTTATLDAGGRKIAHLAHDRGTYVAMLMPPAAILERPASPRLEVAISRDLATWQGVEVGVLPPEADELLDTLEIHTGVIGVAVSGDTTLLQVWAGVYTEVGSTVCGSGRDHRGLVEIGCDGTVDVIVDVDTAERFGLQVPRTFLRRGDRPFVEVDLPAGVYGLRHVASLAPDPAAPDGPRFVAAGWFGNTVWASPDGERWHELATVDRPVLGVASALEPGDPVVLTGLADTHGLPAVATLDLATGDVTERVLPLQGVPSSAGPVAGPAGWSTLVVHSTDDMPIIDGDWVVSGTGFNYSIASLDGAALYWFSSGAAVEGVDRGLFGEARLRRPGTDEVIVEIDRDEARMLKAQGPLPARVAVPTAELEVDGWLITGDPYNGPLTITAPGGTATNHTDGYAFTNGSIDDGVELEVDGIDLLDADLVLYDRGAEVARTSMIYVVEALTAPLGVPDDAQGASEPGDAWLLHSSDGETWQIVWQGEDTRAVGWPVPVVGDEQVLVPKRYSGFEVIPLDPG